MKKWFVVVILIVTYCENSAAQREMRQALWDAQQIVMYTPNEYTKLQRKMQILKRDTSVQGIINRLSTLCMVEPQRITSDKARSYYSTELQIEFSHLCARDSFVMPSILNYYNKQANIIDLFYSTNSYHYWTLEELKELCAAGKIVYDVISSAEDLYSTIEERNAMITANMNHYCFIERKLFGNPTYMIMQEHRCLPDSVKHNIEQITQIQDIYYNIDAVVQSLKKALETASNNSDVSYIVSHALDILTFIAYYGSNNEVKEYSTLLQNSFNLVYGSESLAHLQETFNKWTQSLYNVDFITNYVSSTFSNYRSYADSTTLRQFQQFFQLEDSLRNLGYDFVDVHPFFYDGKYLESDAFHSYRQQKTYFEYAILRELVNFSAGFLQNMLGEQYRDTYIFFIKDAAYHSVPMIYVLNVYVYLTSQDIVSIYSENPAPWILDAMDLMVELYSQLVKPDGFYDYQFDVLYQLATTIPYSDTQLRICKNIIIPSLRYNDFSRMGSYKTEVLQAYAYALSTVAVHDKDSAWSIEADRIYKLSQSLPLYDGMWIRYYLHYVYATLNDREKATLLMQKEYNKTKYLPKEDQQYMRDFLAIILACSYADSGDYDLMIKYMNCVEDFSMLERYQELLTFAYAYLGDETKMKKNLNKYIKEVQHNVQVDLFNCSGEKSSYLEEVIKYAQTMYNSYSIAANDKCKQLLAAACYDITLMTKSILLSVSHQIEDQLAHHPSELIRQQFAHYQELINKPTFNMSVFEKGMHQTDISNTNRTLYAKVREWYDTHEPTFTIYSWQDVRNSLGKDSVAIEFIKYPELNDSVFHYCALALRHDMTYPQCIYLGTDSMLLAAKEGKQIQNIFDMNNLSSLIWSPLIDSLHIQPSEHIFFAADGDLYQIPVEYLPYNTTQTISDVFNMHRVSSTRNIVPLATDTVRDEITLYGGLIYSMDSVTMKQNATQSVKYVNRDLTIEESFGDSLRATRAYINYLPGTLEEINTIKQYFSDTIILTGTMGTEESFKAMSGKGSHILHIGTHGYYLRPSSSEVRSEGIIDYSMSRTGLLFAGAQLAWSGEPVPEDVEDGILTAKEISTLDLQNVQIAVLSACETGTGEITSDGVAGLQRGFKKAGVQTIIMSLWKVDDNATQLLMKEFYRHWMSGKSKHEALRLAQNAVRYAVDEDGDRMFEDPVYWAGFIMLD